MASQTRGAAATKRGIELTTAYHLSLWFDEGPVGPVHLVVEAACVAEVVSISVSAPQRSRGRRAVDTLSALCNR